MSVAWFGWMRQAWVEALGWTLVHSVWELAALGLVGVGAMAAMRWASAQGRYVVGLVLLVLMGLATGGTFGYLLHRSAGGAEAAPTIAAPVREHADVAVSVPAQTVQSALGNQGEMSAVAVVDRVVPYLGPCYLAVLAVLTLRLVVGYGALRRLGRSGMVLEGEMEALLRGLRQRMRIGRPVRLVKSAAVEVPTVLGIVRPLILLPASALMGLSAEHLEALLAHELAHIRRHDYLANLIQSVIETVLFYHPALWWLSRVVREEREHCCDDVAAAIVGNRLGYARALATMESLRTAPTGVPDALAVTARSGSLLSRIRRLLGVKTEQRPGVRVLSLSGAMIVVGIVAMVVYLGCSKPSEKNAATQSAPEDNITENGTNEATTHPVQAATPSKSEQQLTQRISHIRAVGSADKAFAELQKLSHAKIDVRWDVLGAAGIKRDAEVTLDLMDVSLEQALKTLLAQLRSANVQVDFIATGDSITVSTHEALMILEPQIDQQFDIREVVIATIPNDSNPKLATRPMVEQPQPTNDRIKARKEVVKQIIAAIETVDPNSWKDHGGQIGEIHEDNGTLFVHQTTRNMAEINKVMKLMLSAHQLQIGIESRIMFVDDELFNKLAAKFPALLAGATRDGNVPADNLSEEQLGDLLKSIQASSGTISVSAPRVTLFNGQNATITISREQGFLSSGTKGLPPRGELSKIDSGVFMGVRAAISSDRESVALSADLEVRTLLRMDTAEEIGPDGARMAYQTPILDIRKISTMLTVKSKGTVVLGGMPVPRPQLPDGVAKRETPNVQPESKHLIVLIRPTAIIPHDAESPK